MSDSAELEVGRVLRFELRDPTPTNNEVIRLQRYGHADRKKALAWEIRIQLLGKLPAAPFARARITIERRSLGDPDEDNLWGGLKWLLDVLQPPTIRKRKKPGVAAPLSVLHKFGLGIIAEDNKACLTTKVLPVRVGRRKDQKTIVTIEELV